MESLCIFHSRTIFTRLRRCASGYLVKIEKASDSFDSKPTSVLDSPCLSNRRENVNFIVLCLTRFHKLKTDFMSCDVYIHKEKS